MCGILFLKNIKDLHIKEGLKSIIGKRGPDAYSSKVWDDCEMHGWVLHLRGINVQPQPVIINDNVLCFNGEVYDGIEVTDNDTIAFAQLLDSTSTERELLEAISKVQGEFSFVYHQTHTNYLYFGRDFLGRRSLLVHIEDESIAIASVANENCNVNFWLEMETDGIYRIKLDENLKDSLTVFKWNDGSGLSSPDISLNTTLPTELDLEPVSEEFPTNDAKLSAMLGLESRLNESVRKRIITIPPTLAGESKLAVLFSGGLDCMVLAALANSYLPTGEPIDLLNVSFENPRTIKAHQKQDPFDVPDRLTGKLGAEELKALYPHRTWRFVRVDVPYAEAVATRPHIQNLMKPLSTVMDLSIAIAFWFAARGKGTIEVEGQQVPYISHAKVLFSGLGADEQLGGYSRHRGAFERNGWPELVAQLALDVGRIGNRNLGRDDRIISDHGKEVRFPFLDENVITYLSKLPVYLKTDPRYSRAIGDKILLRILASKLNLKRASVEPKRAVQFGAKTAKMEFSSEKGGDLL
ncbi:Asparagine synthetase domain-containing protein 1 [Boothiomyces sp. JEL0866]|nr:Asparagine synthetase domain-containing protein 1 [Boothiomyces sp. JEL0866]